MNLLLIIQLIFLIVLTIWIKTIIIIMQEYFFQILKDGNI